MLDYFVNLSKTPLYDAADERGVYTTETDPIPQAAVPPI